MPGRNSGICHGCRAKDHFFADCKRKRPCTLCKDGFEKCFVVEKDNKNKGKLFLCCSKNCGFWEWVDKEESSGPYRDDSANLSNTEKTEVVGGMCRLFQSRVRSVHEELQISVNVNVRAERAQANEKGKHAA